MDSFLQDVRFAARQMLRSRATTLVAIITLALGIGANTSMFTLVNSIMFRSAQAAAPARLAWLTALGGRSRNQLRGLSYPDYIDIRDRAKSFSGVAAYTHVWLSLGGEKPERIRGQMVTGNYFDVLGVRAALGRTIRVDEDAAPGANAVAVLSDDAWRTRFGSDPGVLNKSLIINGHAFTVVGVMPPEFTGVEINDDSPLAIWVPLAMVATASPGDESFLTDRQSSGWIRTFGRMSPNANLASVNAELAVLAPQLHTADAKATEAPEPLGLSASALIGGVDPSNRQDIAPVLTLLMLVPLLVLVVACANAANVLLARGLARRKELAVRRAIGASRWRLVRQLLTESVLLTLLAAALGVVLSFWMTGLITRLGEVPAGVTDALTPDRSVLFATTLLAVVAGMLFGLAPALTVTRAELVPDLKAEGVTLRVGRHRHRLRDVFMVGQVAVSLVLLVTAGLFARSLAKSLSVDPGYRAREGVYLSYDLARQNYSADRRAAFNRDLLAKAAALPGVQAVALASGVPFGGSYNGSSAKPEGADEKARGSDYFFSSVTPAYFDALEIPMSGGRAFNERDLAGAPQVVIVNETLARRLWPGENAIGKRARMGIASEPLREVVGVVRDGKYGSLTESPRGYAWIPLAQKPTAELTLVARTEGNASTMIKPLTAVMHTLDADLPVFNGQTFAGALRGAADIQRAASSLLAVFGALALVLAALGMFSVTAHGVALRTREIGIRMSLGARSTNVTSMFVREGLARSGIGIGIGLLISAALSRLLAQFLFGLAATDALTFGGGALVLCAVAALASFLPARRAAKVDPLVALRHE